MSHNCGNNWKLMDIFIEAGFECYQSIQAKTGTMDIKVLKERYGDLERFFWYDVEPDINHVDFKRTSTAKIERLLRDNEGTSLFEILKTNSNILGEENITKIVEELAHY